MVPEPSLATVDRSSSRLRVRHPELLALVAGAVALRLPNALSRAPLVFDDSVYLASVGAMREGGLPFRDVFSSQGPAFLPLLWVADLVGLRTHWSPRLLPLIAGVALVVLVHRLARQVGDRAGAALAAFLVATSGAAVFATDRILSDGVAAAFGAAAILSVVTRRSKGGLPWAGALLLGVALATKSLFVGPAALALMWLALRRLGGVRAVAVGAIATLTTVVLALPWGIGRVWDQYVGLHLRVGGELDIERNSTLLRQGLRTADRLLVGVAVASLTFAVVRRLRAKPPSERAPAPDLVTAAWIWLAAGTAVLLVHEPLFFQHLVLIVPPAAVLIAHHRPPVVVAVAVVAVLLPSHASAAAWRTTVPQPSDHERAMIDVLERLEPHDGAIITDEPALVWAAGRTSPGSMVDLSFVRIHAGDLTTTEVIDAAHERDVCAVLFWSERLDDLPGLREGLDDYRSVFDDGPVDLWVSDDCRAPEAQLLRLGYRL